MLAEGLNILRDSLSEDDLQTSLINQELGAFQFVNSGTISTQIEVCHEKPFIHFLFSLSGEITVSAKSGEEQALLTANNFFMFSNPFQETKLCIVLPPLAKILSIIISMKELHEIFGSSFGRDESGTQDLMESYKMQRYFIEKEIEPSIAVITHQFFNSIKRSNVLKIYQQGKVMEFLSLYMDMPNSVKEAGSRCPFVMDSIEIEKIKEVREIIVKNIIDPPSLKALARLVGTNEFKLKVGFKSVFSNTVYGYLTDYRMEQARKLLTVDKSRIKEVASQVGYSNSSHFITAYKRKYGITPKQHLKSMVS